MVHPRSAIHISKHSSKTKALAFFGGHKTLSDGDIVPWPAPTEEHVDALIDVVKSGRYHRVNHPAVASLETEFNAWTTPIRWKAVSSGTAAIHVALDYYGTPGRRVGAAALNWPGAVSPIYVAGMRPIYMDVSLNDACLETRVASNEGTAPSIVLNTHLFGNRSQFPVAPELRCIIEDCAQAIGAVRDLRMRPNLRTAIVVSGNGAKHLGAGELGLIGGDDPGLLEHVDYVSLSSSSRSGGRVFSPMSLGFNYRPNPFSAAIATTRIRDIQSQLDSRRNNVNNLWKAISVLPGLRPVFRLDETANSYCVMALRIVPAELGLPECGAVRDRIVDLLISEGVPASVWMRKPVWEYLPYREEVSLDDYPHTKCLLRTMFHISEVAPPNNARTMQLYAQAFFKIWDAIPYLTGWDE